MKKFTKYSAILILITAIISLSLEGAINKIKIYKRWNEELQKDTYLKICLNNFSEHYDAEQVAAIKFLIDNEPDAEFLFSDPYSIDLSEIPGSLRFNNDRKDVMDQYYYALATDKKTQNIITKVSYLNLYRSQFIKPGIYTKEQLVKLDPTILRKLDAIKLAEILIHPIKKLKEDAQRISEQYESLAESSTLKKGFAIYIGYFNNSLEAIKEIEEKITALAGLNQEEIISYLFNKFKALNELKAQFDFFIKNSTPIDQDVIRSMLSLESNVDVNEYIAQNSELSLLPYAYLLLYLHIFIDNFDFGFLNTCNAILNSLNASKIYLFKEHLDNTEFLDSFLEKLGYSCVCVYTDSDIEFRLNKTNKIMREFANFVLNNDSLENKLNIWSLQFVQYYTSMPNIVAEDLEKLIQDNVTYDETRYRSQERSHFKKIDDFAKEEFTKERFGDLLSDLKKEIPDYTCIVTENGKLDNDSGNPQEQEDIANLADLVSCIEIKDSSSINEVAQEKVWY